MTATMKIVRLLECQEPVLATMFTEPYRVGLLKNIETKTLDGCKTLVEDYIQKNLSNVLITHKLYCYRKIDDIVVELLLKPVETASIMEYHLIISKKFCKLERIR